MKITKVKSWERMQELHPTECYLYIGDSVKEAVAKAEKRGIEVKEVFVFGKQIRIAKVQNGND